ncbi:MAG: methyltransferase domain-containing protein [bacterium]
MSELSLDRAAHHAWLVAQTTVPPTGVAVDLGCGHAEDLRLLAARHVGTAIRFVGIDISDAADASVRRAAATDSRISFQRASLNDRLPFEDASVDLAYSHNLIECLRDPASFAREIARVLRPGGQLVMAHWDWDSQLFDGVEKTAVRGLVAAFADWQQGWMEHADGWMGRRLWGIFNATGSFEGAVQARVLINTEYQVPWFGHQNALSFASLVKRGLAASEDYEGFLRDQEALQSRGQYFYSITGYAYVGHRRPLSEG